MAEHYSLKQGNDSRYLRIVPDGCLVLVHDRRYPYDKGETIGRVSEDGGKTWLRKVYPISITLFNIFQVFGFIFFSLRQRFALGISPIYTVGALDIPNEDAENSHENQ